MAKKVRKKSSKVTGSSAKAMSQSIMYLDKLSDELLCHVLSFLPLKEVLLLGMLCKRLYRAVQLHLRLRKVINFTEGKIYAYMPPSLTDEQVANLLGRCHKVVKVLGLHPQRIEKRRQRNKRALSIPGVIEALSHCENLQGVETSDLKLMEAILQNLPEVDIIGHFWNRGGQFPIPPDSILRLPPYPHLTSLHLTGVEVFELPQMLQLEYIFLQWVRFTRQHPFRTFVAPNLHTFVMKNCAGPTNSLKYVSLIVALARAPRLSRLTLIRVPFLGGSIQRVVEDHMRSNGFQALTSISFGSCRHLVEADLGYLMLTCNQSLETLQIQPSMTKDSVFTALQLAEPDFSKLQNLHLGYIDDFPPKGTWSNEELMAEGLADVVELPASITDVGMQIVNRLFPKLTSLTVNWCPHLMQATIWHNPDTNPWTFLHDLILKHCHCLKLEDFQIFLSSLPSIEYIILEDIFREPPRGCSHVGLSAATGLGMTSAIVSGTDNEITLEDNFNNDQNVGVDDGRELQEVAAADAPNAQNVNNRGESLCNTSNSTIDGPQQNQLEAREADNRDNIAVRSDTNNNDIAFYNSRLHEENQSASESASIGDQPQAESICPQCGKPFIKIESVHNLKESSEHQDKEQLRNYCSCGNDSNFIKGDKKSSRNTDEDPLAIPGPSGLCRIESKKDSKEKVPEVRIGENGKQLIDCGCQVNSDDIRQATKKLIHSSSSESSSTTVYCGPGGNLVQGNSDKTESNKTKRKQSKKRNAVNRKIPRKKNMCDKATSTSDPVFIDEPEQVFRIVSNTLVSLTVISCGISVIQVDHCPRLEHLEAEACSVLKKLVLISCPNLIRVNISQCPQANVTQFAKEVGLLPNRRDRLIFYRPYQQYSDSALKKELLQDSLCKYHVCVVEDYSPVSDDCIRTKQIVFDWLRVFHNINYDFVKRGLLDFTEIEKRESFPWSRPLYSFHSSYGPREFLIHTDVLWLRELWHLPIQTKEGGELPWNPNLGLYQPYRHGHMDSQDFIKRLQPLVQEVKEASSIYLHTLGIYVHLGNDDESIY